MDRRQSGFTLIELIVVIVILAILAATALPRFADLGRDARIAAVQGMAGGTRGAAALAHSVSVAQGRTSSEPISMAGTIIDMEFQYPTTAVDGIARSLDDFSGFSYDPAGGAGGGEFRKIGAPDSSQCRVSYIAPTTLGDAPTIFPSLTGC